MTTITDDAGEFIVTGLPPGQAFISARASDGAVSNRLPITVSEDEEAEVELVLHEITVLRGRVVSPYGGAPAAAVVAVPLLIDVGLGTSIPKALTQLDGSFEVPVPANAVGAYLFVRPNGLSARLVRVGPDLSVPVKIDVNASGGSLHITSETGPAGLELLHDGVHVQLGMMQPWSRPRIAEGGAFAMELPLFAPGYYQVCRWAIPPFLQNPPPPSEDACVGGFLAPNGKLTLDVPNLQTKPDD